MTITLLQMVEQVLEEEKRPLSAWQIWQVAENKGYDKLVESTSSTSLSILVDADVRDNPSSIFVALGDRPKRFMLKSQMYKPHLLPGNKVRVLEHVLFTIDLGIGAVEVDATKGSIGTIISYEEYSAHTADVFESNFESRRLSADLRYLFERDYLRHLEWLKSAMSAGTDYPLRFEEVIQPSEGDYADWKDIDRLVISCQVGAISVIPSQSFVVIEKRSS